MGDRYRQLDIETASPVELVSRLYAGAMLDARRARDHHQAGRLSERGTALSRAIAIVGELRCALDMERGGEIALQLHALYGFVSERLLEANLRGRVEAIDEALGVLSTLSEAWDEISRGSHQGAA